MPLDGWLTLIVVVGATVAMSRDIAPDLTMFSALSLVVVAGIVPPDEALLGFANTATATIAVLFVVAAALQETGALTLVSNVVFGRTKNPRQATLRMVTPVAVLSAFMNNTPIVAMLIPVVRDFARRIGDSPSRYLIPLAYAALLGGTCTLIGTSSNLVVAGLLEARGLTPIGMFELTPVGVPTVILGLVYLATAGRALLPSRTGPRAAIHERPREYLAEVAVAQDSPLVGRTIEDAGLRHLPGLFLVEIRRAGGRTVRPVTPQSRLMAGDHLVLTGVASTVQDLRQFPGLTPVDDPHLDEDDERGLFEVVVSHNSDLIGRTVRDVEFRRRFGAAILAVHRSGERIDQKIGDIVLEPGDTLMLIASPGFLRAWRDSAAFYLVSEVDAGNPPRYRQANISMGVLAGLVLMPALTGIPMLVSAMAALVVLLGTRCITPRRAREAVQWHVLVLIGSAFGLARALELSGAATWVADGIVGITSGIGPIGLLAGVYVLGAVFASFVSSAAAAALVFPIAVTAAEAAALDPRPFAIAVALAASAAFSTPITYANLLVYGPGGYRYLDFVRVGLPLNALCLAVALLLVPWVWPLVP